MDLPRMIGIYSPVPGSGKTTIANFLVEKYDYHRVPFAEPLKLMARSLMESFGYSAAHGDRLFNNPALKEQILPELNVTPRFIMQTLGTEWGRELIHREIWLLAWKKSIERFGVHGRVVVDDIRFPNELEIIKSQPSSTLWWVDRPKLCPRGPSAHVRRFVTSVFGPPPRGDGWLARFLWRNTDVAAEVMAHSSQQILDRALFDETIVNNGTIKDLDTTVFNLLVKGST